MKKSKTVTKYLALTVAILTAVTLTLSLIPGKVQGSSVLGEIFEKLSPGKVGGDLKEIIKREDNLIIAEVNGEKILKKEFDFIKYLNDVSYNSSLSGNNAESMKSDDEIIKMMLFDKIMQKKMIEMGFVFPYEDKLKELKEEQKEKEVNPGYEDKRKEDEEFFAGLGMTADEYLESMGIEMEMKSFYRSKYIDYFYSEIYPNLSTKGKTFEETMQIFQDHLNSLLEGADCKIYYEELDR